MIYDFITVESGCDNREVLDDNQSQSLSKDDIKQMKESGKTGQEVRLK